jgi:hypothetical protein
LPNHLHLELVGLSATSDAIKLLHNFKGIATSRVRALGVRNLWEKGFYDHILRGDDDNNAVAWYIFNNPVRKGLVKDPRDWPYSGSWMFDWKKAVAPVDAYVPPWKWRRVYRAILPGGIALAVEAALRRHLVVGHSEVNSPLRR